MTIRCTGCKHKKDASHFSRNSKRPNGFQPKCRACMRAYINEWERRPDKRSA